MILTEFTLTLAIITGWVIWPMDRWVVFLRIITETHDYGYFAKFLWNEIDFGFRFSQSVKLNYGMVNHNQLWSFLSLSNRYSKD